jgi:hypothetical protein
MSSPLSSARVALRRLRLRLFWRGFSLFGPLLEPASDARALASIARHALGDRPAAPLSPNQRPPRVVAQGPLPSLLALARRPSLAAELTRWALSGGWESAQEARRAHGAIRSAEAPPWQELARRKIARRQAAEIARVATRWAWALFEQGDPRALLALCESPDGLSFENAQDAADALERARWALAPARLTRGKLVFWRELNPRPAQRLLVEALACAPIFLFTARRPEASLEPPRPRDPRDGGGGSAKAREMRDALAKLRRIRAQMALLTSDLPDGPMADVVRRALPSSAEIAACATDAMGMASATAAPMAPGFALGAGPSSAQAEKELAQTVRDLFRVALVVAIARSASSEPNAGLRLARLLARERRWIEAGGLLASFAVEDLHRPLLSAERFANFFGSRAAINPGQAAAVLALAREGSDRARAMGALRHAEEIAKVCMSMGANPSAPETRDDERFDLRGSLFGHSATIGSTDGQTLIELPRRQLELVWRWSREAWGDAGAAEAWPKGIDPILDAQAERAALSASLPPLAPSVAVANDPAFSAAAHSPESTVAAASGARRL